MLKRIAIIFGVVFLVVGILGFVQAITPMTADTDHGRLFGIFAVDPLHNWVHILTGIVAMVVGFTSEAASRMYFRIFGIVYALVAIAGFFYGNSPLFGMMAHNMADAVLHTLIAAVSLYLGFGRIRTPAEAGADQERHRPA